MAEMTAKQAIAVLHNNQYQKHIANGEYDYIHPLTDAECKGIESLIQQQQQQIEQQAAEIAKKDRMIDKACDRLSNYRKCPPEICDLPYHPGDVECFKHWRKWLEKEAQGWSEDVRA